MKKYKYEKIEDTFIDYTGEAREFTMVAVSIPLENPTFIVEEVKETVSVPGEEVYNEETDSFEFMPDDEEEIEKIELVDYVNKVLSFAVSVRSNNDDKIEGLSEKIAYGKALIHRDHTIYTNNPGMINTIFVKNALKQEAEYFKKDPGYYIKGYNKAKKNYDLTGEIAIPEQKSKDIKLYKTNIDNLKHVLYNSCEKTE